MTDEAKIEKRTAIVNRANDADAAQRYILSWVKDNRERIIKKMLTMPTELILEARGKLVVLDELEKKIKIDIDSGARTMKEMEDEYYAEMR